LTREELEQSAGRSIDERIRDGVRAVIEQVLQEEMAAHLQARHRERTAARRGERNGSYARDLITPVGKIEQLQVPRDRAGEFLTEVFGRYQRMTGNVEEAVLQGVSTRRVAEVTSALSGVAVGKDAVSRIAGRLDEHLRAWRERRLDGTYPYLFLDATYLKVNWGSHVGDLALLVAVGVNEQGSREVLAVEAAAGERKEAYRSLLKGLLERGLHGVQLVISDDHESIKSAVQTELPSARWQRCVVHFERNVLAHVPAADVAEVASDLKAIFSVHRAESAAALAEAFAQRYQKRFARAVATLKGGLADALTFLAFPSSHHRLLRSTNGLERLFGEVKRRTRVVGVFPNEASATNLCSAVMLRASEEWALRRYLDMAPLQAMNTKTEAEG
jgi:transposase-like protein